MYFCAEIVDDLLREVLQEILTRPFDVETTRGVSKGNTSEINCLLLELKNPLARLSRTESRGKPFSAIGELLWYLSGSKKLDFIKHYISKYEEESEDKLTLYGAYGPRLFGGTNRWISRMLKTNQIENVINLLRNKPTSRRAVVQLFDAKDLRKNRKEIPCTCTLQFLVRNEKLIMIVNMRSNDAYLGLPHDIFAFTMIQEIVAKSLNRELGSYFHFAGNMHLYESDKKSVEKFLSEGWQSSSSLMPPMPISNLWSSIDRVLKLERSLREGKSYDFQKCGLDPYWKDLVNLVEIHCCMKSEKKSRISEIRKRMYSKVFNVYIDKRLELESSK